MVIADTDYKIVNDNQIWFTPTDHGTAPALPTASAKGASTRSSLEKYTKHTNRLLQQQHAVCQHQMNKIKYKKYQAVLMALNNLITNNIEEYCVSAHNNSKKGFHTLYPIIIMDYIWTNYETVLLKQL